MKDEMIINKMIASFVHSPREADGKYICALCPASEAYKYVHWKRCAKHICTDHLTHPDFLAKYEELTKAKKDAATSSITAAIKRFFADFEERFKDIKREFLDYFDDDSMEQGFAWKAEGLINMETKIKIVREVKKVYEKRPLKDFIEGLESELITKRKHLIDFPYQHNSTSLMSNAVSEWAFRAKCELYNTHNLRSLGILIYYCKELLKLEEE